MGSNEESTCYIVLLKENITPSLSDHLNWLKGPLLPRSRGPRGAEPLPTVDVKQEYDDDALRGYSAALDESTLKLVNENDDVDLVVEDTLLYLHSEFVSAGGPPEERVGIQSQRDAPWGLQRISSRKPIPADSAPGLAVFEYPRDLDPQGTEVDVYVIDTGVQIDHAEFEGPEGSPKRADFGYNFTDDKDDGDLDGHGTHVAGIIAGNRFGVAKHAHIISVKVFSSSNDKTCRVGEAMAGIYWAVGRARQSGRPSIINASFGGPANEGLDRAVAYAVRYGVHVCVSAGNDREDAGNHSPARAKDAITVGASTIEDKIYEKSNYGEVVNIFAPGRFIRSAGIASPTADALDSGTSMAAPHVAGVLAYMLRKGGPGSPAELREKLLEVATKNVFPQSEMERCPNTVNLLVYNGL